MNTCSTANRFECLVKSTLGKRSWVLTARFWALQDELCILIVGYICTYVKICTYEIKTVWHPKVDGRNGVDRITQNDFLFFDSVDNLVLVDNWLIRLITLPASQCMATLDPNVLLPASSKLGHSFLIGFKCENVTSWSAKSSAWPFYLRQELGSVLKYILGTPPPLTHHRQQLSPPPVASHLFSAEKGSVALSLFLWPLQTTY